MLLLSLAAIAAVGCQRASESPSGSTTTTGTSPSGTKTTIVFIPKQSGNTYFNEVEKGLKEASDTAGCDFTTNAPPTGDPTSQLPIIKDQIQRHVDAIVISPNSPDALNVALDEAKKAGIVVLTVDADLVGNETHRDVGVLSASAKSVGEGQIECLGKQIDYEGDFAILSATRDSPNQNAWIAEMKTTLANPKYAKMKLVDIVYGDDDAQKSATEFEALLAKNPNLRGVIAPTSVGLAAAAQSLETAGVYPGGPKAKGKGLVLTGLSTPDQLHKFVTNGVIGSFQLWKPADMGSAACGIVMAIKSGKLKPAEGAEYDDPKLGKLKFEKNNVVYAAPLITFDKSNIDQFKF